MISFEGRCALGVGICTVFASLPNGKGVQALGECISCVITSLQRSLVSAGVQESFHQDTALDQLACEIRLVGTLVKSFSGALLSLQIDGMRSGLDTSPETRAPIRDDVLLMVRTTWPFLLDAARRFSDYRVCCSARRFGLGTDLSAIPLLNFLFVRTLHFL